MVNAKRPFGFLAAALLSVSAASHAAAADDAAAREARWTELKQAAFGDRPIAGADGAVTLDAPERAEDAALVPVTLKSGELDRIKSMTLIIDDNPSPLAAKLNFGPAGDAGRTSLRVRVNAYTNMHLVAETADGALLQTRAFVKASGGCSAPVGVSDEEALAGVGEMRLRIDPAQAGRARLMIRHPNFTGMQMDVVTQAYTPARYLKDVTVAYDGQKVFSLAGDISISANPVIEFGFKPKENGAFKVTATDTDGERWERTFVGAGVTN